MFRFVFLYFAIASGPLSYHLYLSVNLLICCYSLKSVVIFLLLSLKKGSNSEPWAIQLVDNISDIHTKKAICTFSNLARLGPWAGETLSQWSSQLPPLGSRRLLCHTLTNKQMCEDKKREEETALQLTSDLKQHLF